jgi:hypothetical protein
MNEARTHMLRSLAMDNIAARGYGSSKNRPALLFASFR